MLWELLLLSVLGSSREHTRRALVPSFPPAVVDSGPRLIRVARTVFHHIPFAGAGPSALFLVPPPPPSQDHFLSSEPDLQH